MKKIFTFILLLLRCVFCSAQDAPANVNSSSAPSPNALGIVSSGSGGYNVDLHSGRLNYNAPICSYNLSKINIPIGVSYASSGIKVQDIPGVLGTGWQLNAGGVITRFVQSLPDEDPNGYSGANNIGDKTYSAPDSAYFRKIIDETWDAEPDKFSFSFLSFSGVFELDKDGNPVMQSSYGIKMIYSPFNRSTGRRSGGAEDWIIKDMAGNTYYFGDGSTETSHVTIHGKSKDKTKDYISSWYISKIVTADNQVINFQYTAHADQSFTNYVNVYSPPISVSGQCSTSNRASATWNENTDVTISSPLFLTKITSSIYEIDFVYDNTPLLLRIDAYQKGQLEFSYSLGYDLLFNNGQTLHLLSNIQQKSLQGNDVVYLYGFNYNKDQNLPARNSIQTDYWGYYNSNPGTSNIQGYNNGDKSPDPIRTQANILVSVNNQYGGLTSFTYEGNNYASNNTSAPSGGVRVKNVSTFINGITDRHTDYTYVDPTTGISSGQLYSSTNKYSLPVDILLVAGTLACSVTGSFNYSESLSSLFDMAGVQTGYSYIKITEVDNSSTQYHLTNFSDYPDVLTKKRFISYTNTQNDATDIDVTPQFTQTSYAFARGKILDEELKDAAQNIVQRTSYHYTLSSPIGDVIGMKAYVQRYVNGLPTYYINGKYDFQTQDLLLDSKTEVDNYYNGSSLTGSSTNTETYSYTFYAGSSFRSLKTRTLSNGSTEKTLYRYPFDVLLTTPPTNVSNNLPVSFLVQNNMIAQPLEVVKTILRNGAEAVISVSLTKYSAANATVKPLMTYRLKTSQSLLKSAYQNYSVSVGGTSESETIDPNLEPVQVFAYDSKGNINSSRSAYATDGQKASLWGYDGNYMIAQAQNAKPNELFYDGFEESGLWPSVTYDNAFKHSGGYSARIDNTAATEITSLSNNWLTVALTAPKMFRYSGWVYSNKPSVDIYLFMKRTGETGYYTYIDQITTTVTGKWVYLEKEFSVPADVTQLNIRLDNNGAANGGGTVWFDDIRLYPSDALMSSYSYEPLVGLTGSVDTKGQTLSYEFDGFKRLITEKDLSGNITKSHTYNKKLYKNHPVSQDFSKSCPNGFTTSPVTYTVNEGKYTSYLSQQDADQQAQADLKSQGQAYAENNGICIPGNMTLTLTNSTGVDGYQASFLDASTSRFVAGFTFPANGTTTVQIPAGTYTITIPPAGTNLGATHSFQFTGKANIMANGATFSNAVITDNNSLLAIH